MNKSTKEIKQNTRALVSREKSEDLGGLELGLWSVLSRSKGIFSCILYSSAVLQLLAVQLLLCWPLRCSTQSFFQAQFHYPVFRAFQIHFHFPSQNTLPSLLFQCHLGKINKQIYSHTDILKYIYCF